ncbi:dihydroorotase [Pelistega sp. NLN82]|uniref:Dihydroorotase n=1 Tax=Pelistega ratti TaxID=2652177 RepID=A0A6L9Y5I5_9BURK|nr:dihydroorotase [Pelistega ratti]NEN75649.1 dihydroorotase [Pelistega ratti]
MQITSASITLIRPDDWHLHLRDGEALAAVVADSARQFSRAIVMPNLKPPVTTVEMASAYKARIEAVLAQQNLHSFTPLMTLYLTNNTSVEDVKKAAESGFVKAFKLYPAGATTNSDAGVTDLLGNCSRTLEAMQQYGMPLLVHGEVTDPRVDLFDREAVFIDRVMLPLRRAFPALKVVFEHITTKQGAHYVRDAEGPIGATITPQHLLFNRNAIFQGGVRPHYYCLPVLKREEHRIALVEAATSGNPRFFLGTDSAPHAKHAKEASCGCAGCYSALHAMELYATAFEKAGKLDQLEGFASLHGPQFYGLPVNTETITLERKEFEIPQQVPYTKDAPLVPLSAGEVLPWRFVA